MINPVKSILIVGGGSSGWMAAAGIVRQLPNVKVTLVESQTIPTIGVGESTIGHINQYMHFIGLQDTDWMHHCNATYKTSIKFVDFRENPTDQPHEFHYPFGIFDTTDKPRGLMDWFIIKAMNPEIDPSNFAEFFHDMILMADQNKLTDNKDFKLREFNFDSDTAYHMDAALFGNYLCNHICLPAGMTHIVDDVINIVTNEHGVESIITKNHGTLSADLFVDCTGFKSLLLEQTLNVPFISFNDTLANDRAVATVIPYIDKDKELENYTSCTAIDAGWVWNIPLWNRIGTGYVYSSKFATEAEAEEQFRQHLASNRMTVQDKKRAESAELRHIKIKHGVHERAWEKNVVGIGLANGFIEPLESTGLMLTHEGIIKMISALKMRNGHITKYDIDCFNYAFREQITGFKEFISQHYALSMRNDTPYWKHVTEHTEYSRAMTEFKPEVVSPSTELAYRLHRSRIFDSGMSGIVYIAAGMGYNPIDAIHADYLNKTYRELPNFWVEVFDTWKAHRDQVLEHIKTLPTHREFLEKNIYRSK